MLFNIITTTLHNILITASLNDTFKNAYDKSKQKSKQQSCGFIVINIEVPKNKINEVINKPEEVLNII